MVLVTINTFRGAPSAAYSRQVAEAQERDREALTIATAFLLELGVDPLDIRIGAPVDHLGRRAANDTRLQVRTPNGWCTVHRQWWSVNGSDFVFHQEWTGANNG